MFNIAFLVGFHLWLVVAAWPAALPCWSLLLHSGGRTGSQGDGGECRGAVHCPNSGIGHFSSMGFSLRGNVAKIDPFRNM